MDIPEELDLSGEDDALSQDQLDVLGERQDIEVYTDTGTKLSMRSLLDTGSVVNTIRHELVLDSGHAIEPYDGREVVGFNGTSFMPKGKVVVRLHFTDSAKALRTWKVTFLIVPDTCPCDVVFGRGFIERSNFYKFHGENLVLEFAKESKGTVNTA